MKKCTVTLSEPVSEMVRAQVKSGRYKDFSAALQDAAWNFFYGPPSPFEEYGVTAAEVERTAQRDLAAIRKDRKAGRIKSRRGLPFEIAIPNQLTARTLRRSKAGRNVKRFATRKELYADLGK